MDKETVKPALASGDNAGTATPSPSEAPGKSGARSPGGKKMAALSMAALGIVYGDIGTSPLYALREAFYGDYRVAVTPDNVLGVLSLMFWSLVIIVSIKYLTFILRADNRGEGGVIALTALLLGPSTASRKGRWFLVAMGLFGASLLYGDGMITPAISVLSAIEGLRNITPSLEPFVVPTTVVILATLFLVQHRGTARVGSVFGPVILTWLVVIAFWGVRAILACPQVLAAVFPWYGIAFLMYHRGQGFLALGAVFLVVTGAEALYADLGHFGSRPIRLTWFAFVLPALLLNYFGQGAKLLLSPSAAMHPFYALVPAWALIPMVVLAAAATIIASQAVISGAFSLTRQAIQMGFLPRLRIVHTSAHHQGQIYLPPVNWALMIACIGLVLGFRSSNGLAAAYGVAVTSTMLISTILFFHVAYLGWKWPLPAIGALTGFFLIVDITFFAANLSKILHGAWFPLVIGGMVFTLMVTWRKGRDYLWAQIQKQALPFDRWWSEISATQPLRIGRKAIFLTGNPNIVPFALIHNLTHNQVLHSEVVILYFATENVPRVALDQKVTVDRLGGGFFRVTAHFGFMENPDIAKVFALMRDQGLDYRPENTSFFLGRQTLLISEKPAMGAWRAKLFAYMSRNALDAATFYEIPPEQVMEVGVQLPL